MEICHTTIAKREKMQTRSYSQEALFCRKHALKKRKPLSVPQFAQTCVGETRIQMARNIKEQRKLHTCPKHGLRTQAEKELGILRDRGQTQAGGRPRPTHQHQTGKPAPPLKPGAEDKNSSDSLLASARTPPIQPHLSWLRGLPGSEDDPRGQVEAEVALFSCSAPWHCLFTSWGPRHPVFTFPSA